MSSGYLLPFEIVSIHLLVVLIGAAYLARAKRRVVPPSRRGTSFVPSENGNGNGSPAGTIHGPVGSTVGGHAATHEVVTHG